MAKSAKSRSRAVAEPSAIAEIQVAGFKSICDEQCIEIQPLTILAGANSTGKSSIMQPLLLLKQTLEAPYDAGVLLLNGPIMKFTSTEQLLSRIGKGQSLDSFQAGMRLNTGGSFRTSFRKEHKMGFRIERLEISDKQGRWNLWPEMTQAEIVKTGITKELNFSEEPEKYGQGQWKIRPDRCFLKAVWIAKEPDKSSFLIGERPGPHWEGIIPEVIHLPGLRGNPERTYPVTAIGPNYPGTFEKYTASVISQWQEENEAALVALNEDLKLLKLAGGVSAVPVNAVQIELQVGRLPDVPPTRPEDRANVADVGVGVSQTLPILVALHAAKPGQLVYVEQPETHLHPRAQFALAQILAAAAKRGVRVVVETHSSILLLGVQTLVAEGKLEPDKVKLHWFQREKNGRTIVRPGELDEAGAFGDWPEDFDDVALQTQARYLDAASAAIAQTGTSMKGSRRLVIDTSVASAAGGMDTTHPTAKTCRDFLQAVLTICHRAAFPPQLAEEWKKHASRFAQSWQVAMERRQKLDWIEAETDGELRETIAEVAASEKEKTAMEKDAFLLEAALATPDRTVASLDKIVRSLFRALVVELPRIGKIVWINPGSEADSALEWLKSGAKPEPRRRLGYRPKKKK